MTLLVTQGTDIFQASIDAFDFTTDHETLTIAPGIVVASEAAIGVFSNYAKSALINKGNILSGERNGVQFQGANSSVTNAAGALISGILDGADLDGAGSQVFNNSGTVIGAKGDGVYFGANAQTVTLNNHGYIFGADSGVHNISHYAGGTINNFGTIRSASYGIYVRNDATLTTTLITNAATGVIKGGTDAIYSDDGIMFSLNNFGKVIGGIFDNANLHDVVVNHGIIQGPVQLQGGNDFFNGNGGSSGAVFGGAGVDHLAGGPHADLLHGGDNNDTLTGRLGADRFFFDTALNASTNVDKITDFTPAQHDKIAVSATYFTGLPLGPLNAAHFHLGHAVNGNPQIIYHQANGFLYFDPDGTGGEPVTHFATLTSLPVIHNTDFIVIA